MKIYLGPYISRWVSTVHRDYMRKHHGYCWDMEGVIPTKFENYLEKYEDMLQWVYNHTINLYLDKRQRKIKVRIDKWDTWGMFETLAIIILPMLKQLKETKQGSPWVADEDVPDNLGIRSTDIAKKENDWDWDDNVHKRWEWVIDQMIWSFEQIVDENSDDQFFGKNYELDVAGYDIWQARKQNGLNLFGKYFLNLWD